MIKAQNTISTNLILVGISLFGIYPLIPHKFESISVFLFALCSLIYRITTPKKIIFKKTFFLVSSIYFILFLSVLFSEDMSRGLKKMETTLSLLAFPIIFYLFLGKSIVDHVKIKSFFLKAYYISCLIFTTISFYLFEIYENSKYVTKDSNFYRIAIFDNKYIGEHPIYVSIFISIAIIFGFSFFDRVKKISFKNILLAFSQCYLLSLLLMLMSKGVIVSLLMVFIIKLFKEKKFSKVHFFSLVLILTTFFVLIPSENNRFKEIIDINSYKNLDENNSTSIRFMNYKCGIKSLIKRPIFGYGIGDVQEQMDLCYEEENANFPKKRYNTHNQYLFIWLSSGIIGFITFIAILFYYFKKSLQFKDEVMFSILVLYSFTFLFENVLSRQSGVIFFCFIINYFLWNNFNKKKVLSTHE